MKSHYSGLWLIVAVSLIVFLVISFVDDISVGGWTIKKAPFSENLLAKEDSVDRNSDLFADSLAGKVIEAKTDSVPKSILIFGDSMTLNLALRLAQYAKQNGHTLHSVNWDSSNTKIWADCDTLRHFIREFDVDYVFISLGSNELYFKNPESRLPYIKRVLEMIDTIPYVWIGPPNWQKDSGINDLLERTCRSGSFFRTDGMELARKKDHIHPTRAASALWVDSIMRWMPKSAHPILADSPSDSIGRANANVTFLKALNK